MFWVKSSRRIADQTRYLFMGSEEVVGQKSAEYEQADMKAVLYS